jgi:hypothetical protein
LYNNNDKNEYVVAVLAPTGLSAFNVNGLTIHRFFKLPIYNSSNKRFNSRNIFKKEDAKMMRILLKNLKLIIIGIINRLLNYLDKMNIYFKDEISMISSVTLAQIHCRLCEIFNDCDLPFGGKNILLFGDLLQVFRFSSSYNYFKFK